MEGAEGHNLVPITYLVPLPLYLVPIPLFWYPISLSGTSSYLYGTSSPYLVPHPPIQYPIPYLVAHPTIWYPILNRRYPYISLSPKWNFSLLEISFCNGLKYLFPCSLILINAKLKSSMLNVKFCATDVTGEKLLKSNTRSLAM